MAVTELYEVGMRTAPEIIRDRKGEVTMVSAYTSAECGSMSDFGAISTGKLADLNSTADSLSLPYSKNHQQIPNNHNRTMLAEVRIGVFCTPVSNAKH